MSEPAAPPLSDSHTPRIIVSYRFSAEWLKLQTVQDDGFDLGLLVFLTPLMLVGLAWLVYYFYSKQTARVNAGSLVTTVEMMPLSQDPDILLSDQDDGIESEGDACAICLCRLRVEKPRYLLPCHHDCFHTRCIKKWMAIRTVCPICMQDCS